MKQPEINDAVLLDAIFNSIYWDKPTQKQRAGVLSLFKDLLEKEYLGSAIANEICEYLEVEKRGNRHAIASVLFEMYKI